MMVADKLVEKICDLVLEDLNDIMQKVREDVQNYPGSREDDKLKAFIISSAFTFSLQDLIIKLKISHDEVGNMIGLIMHAFQVKATCQKCGSTTQPFSD